MGTYQEIIQQHKQRQHTKKLARLREAITKSEQTPDTSSMTDKQYERRLQHETNENQWKIVCECQKVWYLNNMDIAQVDEHIKYQHKNHIKAVFFKQGSRSQFRGRIPAMVEETDKFGMAKEEC